MRRTASWSGREVVRERRQRSGRCLAGSQGLADRVGGIAPSPPYLVLVTAVTPLRHSFRVSLSTRAALVEDLTHGMPHGATHAFLCWSQTQHAVESQHYGCTCQTGLSEVDDRSALAGGCSAGELRNPGAG